jgi:hypothetical protein
MNAAEAPEPGKGKTPVGGVTGVVGGSGSGGVEPNPLSGYGGRNRRGSLFRRVKRSCLTFNRSVT